MNYREGMWEEGGGKDAVEWRGGKWDNCNSIINKIYFFKKRSAQKGRMEVMLTLGQDLLMATAY